MLSDNDTAALSDSFEQGSVQIYCKICWNIHDQSTKRKIALKMLLILLKIMRPKNRTGIEWIDGI